jgi:hypothetical protein
MANEFARNTKDASFVKTKALPAAAATNQTDTFDLGRTSAYPSPEGVEFEVSIPAMAAHNSASYDVTIKVQHSTDDSSYADFDTGTEALPDIVITHPGVASTGSVARVVRLRLPSNCNRYIQFNQAVTTGGPTLTGSSVTYSLVV